MLETLKFYKNFPKEGINFIDIIPFLQSRKAFTEVIAALNKAVNALPPRERQITSLRYGLNGRREYTQKEVADLLGISQSYISRLEKKIILRLKKEIAKME